MPLCNLSVTSLLRRARGVHPKEAATYDNEIASQARRVAPEAHSLSYPAASIGGISRSVRADAGLDRGRLGLGLALRLRRLRRRRGRRDGLIVRQLRYPLEP